MSTNELFLKVIAQDINVALHVMAKIIGGLFLSPDAIAIMVIFGLGFLAFWIKAKLDA